MTLRLNGDSSGFTEIKAADAAGDNSIKLPASNGSANQLLQNGGTAGELQYTSAGGGLNYDSSGRLLVGTPTARTTYFSNFSAAGFQVEGTGAGRMASVVSNNQDGGVFILGRQGGTTSGGNDLVADGNELGIVTFQGGDGSKFVEGARIQGYVEGDPGASVMPGKLVFGTNAGGAASTPRIEIGSNGALKLLAGCPGIDFSGIQTNNAGMSSETLDSYEEGNCTLGLTGSGSAGTLMYTHNSARYVKIGSFVFVSGYVNVSNKGSHTGSIIITGLPFTVANNSTGYSFSSVYYSGFNLPTGSVGIGGYPMVNTTNVQIVVDNNTSSGSSNWSYANTSFQLGAFNFMYAIQ
jgi:hypothetical protein